MKILDVLRTSRGFDEMNIEDKLKTWLRGDDAVSPVIAVILMVAITVVLAATVYVWVSGFASDTSGPEQASATADGTAVGSNGDINWIRVSLTDAENAPYDESQISYTVLDPDGASFSPNKTTNDDPGDDVLCTSAKAQASTGVVWCDDQNDEAEFHDGDTNDGNPGTGNGTDNDNSWAAGGVLYVPCQAEGDHSITISVKDTTILDSTVDCETQA